MAAQVLKIGSPVMIKGKDGKETKGTLFNWVKSPKGNVMVYHIKLQDGRYIVSWPEQVALTTGAS
jgi:hypothetical protein